MPQEGPDVALTVMLSFPDAESGDGVVESVTSTVKLVAPAAVGVPLTVPPEERVNPAGRALPLASIKVYGATPPVAARLAE